jgi:hypothetical protein
LLWKEEKPPSPPVLFKAVDTLWDHMTLLHPLSYSDTFTAHLNIVRSLNILFSSSNSSAVFDGEEPEMNLTLEEEETEDPDASEMEIPFQPGSRDWLIKPYRCWVKLQMTYYDAVSFTATSMQRLSTESRPISIKVLSLPVSGSELKPWKDVVRAVARRYGLGPSSTDDMTCALEIIDTMRGHYKCLQDKMNYIWCRAGFTGCIHCEAGIASYMYSEKENLFGIPKVGLTFLHSYI